MADTYVSQTETNGYSVGSDLYNGLSKTFEGGSVGPKATIENCIIATGVGDTMTINDGLYVDATNYLNASKAISFEAENRHSVIIRPADTGQTRALHVSSSNVIFGEVVIDADSLTSRVVTTGAGISDVTFSGTKLTGATGDVFGSPAAGTNLTLNNNFEIDMSENTGHLIDLAPDGAGAITIQNGVINCKNLITGSTNKSVIAINPSVADVDVVISDLIFNVNDGDNNGTTLIRCSGASSYDIHDCTVNGIGFLYGAGVVLTNHATLTTDSCDIYNMTGTLGGTRTGGYLIGVGSEATGTGDNSISGIHIYNNSMANSNHGIFVGFNSNAIVEGNIIADVVLGLVAKGDVSSGFGGNIISTCQGAILYSKGSIDTLFGNNTAILSLGYAAEALYAGDNDAVNSTGIVYKNNLVYTDVSPVRVTFSDALNTAIYENNNFYYTEGSLTTSDFQYQGTSYSSLALWEAGVTTAKNNLETDPRFNSTYHLNADSALIGAGVKWWADTKANPVDPDGNQFWDGYVDIGGYSTWSGYYRRIPSPPRLPVKRFPIL